MKTITALPKSTGANTQYYTCREEDLAWIARWLSEWISEMQEVCTQDPKIAREWFRKDRENWPQGRSGANSVAGMAGGCLRKILSGGDLADAHIQAIPRIFEIMSGMYSQREGFEQVTFRVDLFS